MKRLICRLRTMQWTLGYWLRTGDLTATVSGHAFGSPVWFVEDRKDGRVEVERLTCPCGIRRDAWQAMP